MSKPNLSDEKSRISWLAKAITEDHTTKLRLTKVQDFQKDKPPALYATKKKDPVQRTLDKPIIEESTPSQFSTT